MTWRNSNGTRYHTACFEKDVSRAILIQRLLQGTRPRDIQVGHIYHFAAPPACCSGAKSLRTWKGRLCCRFQGGNNQKQDANSVYHGKIVSFEL
jgi:hypothetical protein